MDWRNRPMHRSGSHCPECYEQGRSSSTSEDIPIFLFGDRQTRQTSPISNCYLQALEAAASKRYSAHFKFAILSCDTRTDYLYLKSEKHWDPTVPGRRHLSRPWRQCRLGTWMTRIGPSRLK